MTVGHTDAQFTQPNRHDEYAAGGVDQELRKPVWTPNHAANASTNRTHRR